MTHDSRLQTPDCQVAGLILAAGQSRRMGAFKPLLPFGDKTVVDSCIDAFRASGVENIVVVLGHRAEDLKQYLANSNVTFAVNPDPESQMSDSILAGLREIPDDAKAVLIMPVDYPAVPPDVVRNLIMEWRKGTKIVVPTWEGHGGHPVLIDLSLREELFNLDPKRGLRGMFEVHQSGLTRVASESPYVARDMDTWDDYCALHRAVFDCLPPDLAELEQGQKETN